MNGVLNGIVIYLTARAGPSSLVIGIFNEAKKEGRKLVYASIPGGRWALIHTPRQKLCVVVKSISPA
jgi:hypothetical protein